MSNLDFQLGIVVGKIQSCLEDVRAVKQTLEEGAEDMRRIHEETDQRLHEIFENQRVYATFEEMMEAAYPTANQ